MATTLKDNKISIWLISYDHDPGQTYLFTCPDRAYANVMGSITAYAFPQEHDPCPALSAVIDRLGIELRKRWHKPYVPIQFQNLFVDLRRVDIYHNDDLHGLLAEIYEVLVASPDPNASKLSATVRKLFTID